MRWPPAKYSYPRVTHWCARTCNRLLRARRGPRRAILIRHVTGRACQRAVAVHTCAHVHALARPDHPTPIHHDACIGISKPAHVVQSMSSYVPASLPATPLPTT